MIFDARRTGILKWARNATAAIMRKMVNDKELAEKLIPNFELGCKRITPSDTYLKVSPQF